MKNIFIVIFTFLSFGIYSQSIDDLKSQLESASGSQTANVENAISEAYMGKKDYSKALSFAKDAIDHAESSGEKLRGNINAGNAAKRTKDYSDAIKFFEEASDLAKSSGQNNLVAYSFESIGYCYSSKKKYSKSIDAYEKALAADDYSAREEAKIQSKIGYNKFASGDLKGAISSYKKSDELFDSNPSPKEHAKMLINLAGVYSNYGDYKNASRTITKGMDIAKKTGNGSVISSAEKMKEQVENAKDNKENSVTAFDEDENQATENYIDNIEAAQVKSLAEIENLSIENQVKELKLLNQQNALALKEQEAAAAAKEVERKELENAKTQAELAQVEAEGARTLAWLIGAGIALALVLILVVMMIRNNKKLKDKNTQIAAQNVELDKKNKNITESINYARKIQNALLASNLVLADSFDDHLLFNKPRDIVSGDFSWCAAKGDSCVVALADCTGHGVPGALMSVLAISSLEKIVKHQGVRKPNEILKLLNDDLHSLFGNDESKKSGVKDGMDVVVLNINKTKQEVEFAGSRNSFVKVSHGELTEFKGSKTHLGYNKGHLNFNEQSIPVQKGDALYLYSDGYYDQKGGKEGKKFYPAKFREMLTTHSEMEMKKQSQKFDENLISWSKGYEQIDDILILGIRI